MGKGTGVTTVIEGHADGGWATSKGTFEDGGWNDSDNKSRGFSDARRGGGGGL